ncbi:MAG TPA: protein kinase [Pyrinomonadaceae bacterium]
MTPERWQHIEEIFQTALDLAPQERTRYITNACTGDAELQREVETLLTQYEAAGDFIDEPLYEQSGVQALASLINDEGDPMLGRRVGAYRIEQEIGRGGMGAVYLASRADNAFQKRVAIKVVKRGMDTDFILRRFRHERQILANLDHPNIARLLDGGATEDGRPYFVMEFIEGKPLYHYCDTRRLNVRERLRLFSQVCDAVEYAHSNQVIHRDIKPSNILVTHAGMPKLFDFGIAKLLNPEMASDTAPQTATAMRLMTVEYASPEQVQGLPVTFLSDLYSLGVLLYEMLTGHRPYRFRNRMLHEMARVISEEEPEMPSIAVNRSESLLPAAYVDQEALTVGNLCEMRGETPDSLRRELQGVLDNITLKALRKEPTGRYQSAAALREDITRYLEGRPVSAPLYIPSTAKLAAAAKRVDTQPKEVSIAVLPFKLIGARPSADTGDEYLGVGLADALITRLSNVRRFIVRPTSSVLQYGERADPIRAAEELGVDYVLDGNIRRAGSTLRVTAQLLSASEGATRWAGRFDEKLTDVLQLEDLLSAQIAGALIPQLTGEEQERLAKRGTDDPQAYAAYLRGRYHWHSLTEEGFAKAIQSYYLAIEIDPNYALAYAGIADYYIFIGIYGIMPFAESSLAAKEAAQKALELDDTLAEAHAALAFALVSHDLKWEEAEEHYRRAIKLNPNSVTAHNWYSFRLLQTARFDEALAEINRALELDPITPVVRQSLAWCHYHSGRFDAAVAIHRKIIETEPRFAWGRLTYSWALSAAGKFDEAVAQAEKALEFSNGGLIFVAGLGTIYAAAGRGEEARKVLERLREMAAATHYVSPYFLAMIHCHLGERERALAYLSEAIDIGDAWVTWLAVSPQFDKLRDDSRFTELVRRTRNPALPVAASVDRKSVEKSIAVLPFKLVNLATGGDTEERYLGVGLADALITRLSNVRSLSVRPTSAILRYGQEGADAINAGRELGVNFILDGRIKHAGERIRISLQLSDVQSGASIWAHQLDEQFTDVLSLEDAISEQVAVALISELTTEERHQLKKRGTDNPEAFEAYLRGRYYWNTHTVEGFAKALICYNRAVAHAPDYALAYTGIADYYIFLGVYAVLPFAETSAAAKEAALQAVALDDELPEAYSALGIATMLHDFDWQAAESHLKRAVELNPNYAMGHSWYCYLLGMLGRFDEAFAEVERALAIDPLTPILHHTLNWTYYYARRYEESIASTRKLISNEPQYGLAHIFLCLVLWQTGEYEEAIEAGERGVALIGRSPYTLVWLACAHAAAGRTDEAHALLTEIQAMSATRYVSPYLLAMVYCNLNDKEQAFQELERACEIRDARLVWLGVDPQLDRLRSDPRFTELLRCINYPAMKD